MTAQLQGMIPVRKEPGYTSNDVVSKLRGILHMKRIGHTGTLDPAAEGVLPVCLGSATKLCALIADRDKEYVAVCRLGTQTDTLDMEGEVLRSIPDSEVRAAVTEDSLRAAAAAFTGEIRQVPPMYSAVRIGGRHLYEFARRGEEVEREARTVTVHELEILSVDLPLFTMRVRCSKGTYIRTLCADIGEALGTGAAMAHLTRTRVGAFTLDMSLTLSEIEAARDDGTLPGRIIPIEAFFSDAPEAELTQLGLDRLANGNPVPLTEISLGRESADGSIRMYDGQGRFCALYRIDKEKKAAVPVRMFPVPGPGPDRT